MADRLKVGNQLLIQQALHGYTDGHRLISASMQLPAVDAKTVLVFSDSSGGCGWADDSGYLTGYPLREFGYFALARTWQAPEMSRPGCVWTHTLFVEFSDLANVGSLDGLMALFRRPSAKPSSTDYAEPLVIERGVEPKVVEIGQEESAWCRQLLTALYEYPKDKIIGVTPPFNPEPLLLAMWSQQWPRLRRSFCFCTSTAMDRSNSQLQFDLQLLPSRDRGVASRFPQSRNLTEVVPTIASWMDDAIADMFESRDSLLRSFLHRVGSEIPTGRAAFSALVRLHRLLTEADSQPEAVDAAITVSRTSFSNDLTVVQSMLVGKAAKHAGHLSKDAHNFLLRHLFQLDEKTLQAEAEKIGEATWALSPLRFCELFEGSENEVIVGTRTLDTLSSEQLIDGCHKHSSVVAQILSHRPELTAVPLFWKVESIDEPAFNYLINNLDQRSHAIAAMLKCGERRLAQKAFVRLGSQEVWRILAPAIDHANETEQYDWQPWIATSLAEPGGVAEVLAEGRLHTKKPLAMIARMSHPEQIPNDYGVDPWVLAIRAAKGTLPLSDDVYLMCYLLARAMGSRTRSCTDLAALAFDRVYQAAAKDSIQSDAWRMLDNLLPEPRFWDRWDRCERLRNAMSKLFVERELAPLVFANLTTDDRVFSELVRTTKFCRGGRSYLRLVRKALWEGSNSRSASRINAVDLVLD